eukprot:scaffold28462_cov48-Phaeocystis_antarctica.AAC.1
MAPSRRHQHQGKCPGAARRCGQPRPLSLLGRAGRSSRACFRHRSRTYSVAHDPHPHPNPDPNPKCLLCRAHIAWRHTGG